jgi:precorrin-6B C5,15-methyltransferase / cobalt-precorrin-6B C5,C15-methyltransferase
MTHPIDVIGLGARGLEGLPSEVLARIAKAEFLAGAERHLCRVPPSRADRFIIKDNLAELATHLERRWPKERCVVLATGDPLFYGIGTFLERRFGATALRVEATLSSMQLAFARAGLSWQDAVIASVHGRELRASLLPLLGKWRIGLFTQDGETPARVARFFLDHGCTDYSMWVAENLQGLDECLTHGALPEMAGRRFGSLNVVILQRAHLRQGRSEGEGPAQVRPSTAQDQQDARGEGCLRALAPGIPDDAFCRPEAEPGMLTRQEVRAVLVSKIPCLEAGAVVWEIGAGVGAVTVEMALARPQVEVLALERAPHRFPYLEENLARFQTYNVRAFLKEAPEGLAPFAPEPPPSLVFVGGSGGRLRQILAYSAEALRPGGKVLADFVTLENLAMTLEDLRRRGWPTRVTEVRVARSETLAGLTTLKPLRGVFLVEGSKPA